MARTAQRRAAGKRSKSSTIGKSSKRRTSHYNRWSKSDVRELRQLARSNVPMTEIGRKLGRTEISIRGKAQREGISLKSEGGSGSYARRKRGSKR